jgi:glutamyl/glutaminyl-tRNA synthetase
MEANGLHAPGGEATEAIRWPDRYSTARKNHQTKSQHCCKYLETSSFIVQLSAHLQYSTNSHCWQSKFACCLCHMAPIFASPDIAAIIAAFPPPEPTKGQASLVRSASGEKLYNSQKVLARFETLLETSKDRIPINSLASLLEIRDADWLLAPYHGPLTYSQDGRTLIPNIELRSILDALVEATDRGFVDTSNWSAKHDIHKDSLQSALDREAETYGTQEIQCHSPRPGKRYMFRQSNLGSTQAAVEQAIRDARPEKCDLSSRLSDIPVDLLDWTARSVARSQDLDGDIDFINGKVIFTPSEYHSANQQKLEEARKKKIDQAIEDAENEGFTYLSDSNDQSIKSGVSARISRAGIAGKLRVLDLDDESLVVATQSSFDQALKDLVDAAVKQTTLLWNKHTDEPPSDTQILSNLAATKPLAAHILNSNHRITISSAVHTTFSTLSATDRFDYVEVAQLRIISPIILHAASLDAVSDDALKSRLDTYATELLKTDILPAAIQHLRTSNLLQRDKSRTKDMEKFSLAISSAQSLADISSSSAKLCRKQKIDPPTPSQLREAKLQALRAKLESMNRKRPAMRGSDVLQNTLWISLSAAVQKQSRQDVLFVSSGKDTTRMIKFYQGLEGGDGELAKKLEIWKDKLKAGQAGEEEIKEMKETAGMAVESMVSRDQTDNE